MVLTEERGVATKDAPAREAAMEDGGFERASFLAMGTECEILFEAGSTAAARRFRAAAIDWVRKFEARFSRYRIDSVISKINAAAGHDWVEVDGETEGLFSLCDWFHWNTKKIFDPTALPLLQLWDYKKALPRIPEEKDIEHARSLVGWNRVQRRAGAVFLPYEGMAIDFGGIGKEYAVDRVIEMAGNAGIRNVMVDFGHDLRVHGEPPEGGPWRIGLENPHDTRQCWAGAAIRDRAICSSGDYLRNFTVDGHTYGHIIDPRTGYPVNNGCRSVSVIAPTCTEAGILSTSVFIMGREEGLPFLNNYYQAEGCIWEGSSVHKTGRFGTYEI